MATVDITREHTLARKLRASVRRKLGATSLAQKL